MNIFTEINNFSSPLEKIALFRSYFRGREDLYPRRFENRTSGKSGYSPACGNEWVRGICEKPRIKCSDCNYRRFLPITDEVIHWHLTGKDSSGRDFVLGTYPLLLDETCFFLAADFDKTSWEEDSSAFMQTCKRLGLSAALERSRSGKGAHVWLFFSESISASLARKLGCHILTETMENRPDIGFDSYDRLFPNQDTMPTGGFGNLIALPLQKKARSKGNSVFIDEKLNPYEDQWAFLSSVVKNTPMQVELIVAKAVTKGRVVGVRLITDEIEETTPWKLPPSRKSPIELITDIPKSLELRVGNQIFIAKDALSPALRNRLLRLAAFQNPEFYRAQAMRRPTFDKPRVIACAEDFPNHIAHPRGCLEDILRLLGEIGIKPLIIEEHHSGTPLEVKFKGKLRTEQEMAGTALLEHNNGVLSATTAFGKTVLAAWLIAERKVNTLILVHRKQLQQQWIDRLITFLDIPSDRIGRIGGGKRNPTGHIDVALIQSLYRKGAVDDIVADYGYIIVDECHHLPAQKFEQVTRQAKAKYITGLTATLKRKDGLHPIITMQCGPVRFCVDAKEQAAKRPFEHTVYVRPTPFIPIKPAHADMRIHFNDLYDEIIRDTARNRLICNDVIKSVKEGRSPVVLTERNDHLDILFNELYNKCQNLIVLRGGMSSKELAKVSQRLAEIRDNDERVLLATGKYIGEGFDDARLDTLFLTLPISWQGTIAQYVGRLHRLHDSKKEVQVYDYADLNVAVLERMFNKRCRGYESVGYKIQLPLKGTSESPSEELLPVDPAWKADYSNSVRRLIKDGVDKQLTHLFVAASQSFPQDAEGGERARSATEAFLYRRLESLPQTAGKFKLNESVSIPFDSLGKMEVDLLCQDARLAIEIDGEQHLGCAEAYRRDRRKDVLLQKNGYLILRFLTEDVIKDLNRVLDTIQQTLSHQERVYCKRD